MDEFIQVNMKKYPYVISKSLIGKDTYTIQELIDIISNLVEELERKDNRISEIENDVNTNYVLRKIDSENGEPL